MKSNPKKDQPDLSKRALFFGKNEQSIVDDNGPKIAALAENCLAFQGVACRSCEDACLEDVISFRPQLGGKEFPIIDNDACTGCGDCLSICPASALSLIAAPELGTRHEV